MGGLLAMGGKGMNLKHIGWRRGDWHGLSMYLSALADIKAKHASDYHDKVANWLDSLGWQVKREFPVVLPNETAGRVDIVADHKLGFRIALELDNRTPRGKSILKLQTFPPHVHCAVILRNPK
jgi:hypothetical protein